MNEAPLDTIFRVDERPSPVMACLGAMNFGKRTPEREANAIVSRALELGIRVIDTANAYTEGASERIVGAAIKRQRDDVFLATKCGFGRVVGKPEGLSGARIRTAIDESLQRLGTDYVDLYYLHVPDHGTPVEESLDAVCELLEKKKIRAWGVSNYGAWQILEMITLADARHMPRPIVAQQIYNVLIRQLEHEYFAFAAKYRVHTTVYNPLAGGLLSGKHRRDGSTQSGSRFDKSKLYQGRYFTEAMFDRVDALAAIAKEASLSLVTLAYAWLADARGVGSVLLGPATVAHLEEGVAALAVELAPETRRAVDALHRDWQGTDASYVR